MTDINAILDHADDQLDASLDRLFDLLRIPSISTDPEYKAECRMAGQWVVDQLAGMGFEASLRDTPGHPMVVGHYAGPAGAPHVLFYGHYDVQPADPIDKWNTPPFEPKRVTGEDGVERIYARGANDDKGQLMTFLEASRAWIKTTGGLPFSVTVLCEGEEESGSPSLDPFLKANAEELSREVALVCDTGMWDPDTPAISTRLRGMAHEEITIIGPRIDLHSGFYGGAAWNPIHILAKILADMRDDDGHITIPGFYDGVPELPPETAAQWQSLDFDEGKFLGDVGLVSPAGEKGRSVLEMTWSRPTLEVNGIFGGYTAAGSKTVIPSEATAKVSMRLVGQQDPDLILKAFRKFVSDRLPEGCSVEHRGRAEGSPAIEIAEDNPYLQEAASALEAEWGKPTVMMGCGGSIPVVRSFEDILGMKSLLVGFGLPDDALHSPNEKYNLRCFHKGIRSWVRIIGELAD
jgi:acetylornithine deacetylase/succinyl-diaminopimelate desuccinylase-like protein